MSLCVLGMAEELKSAKIAVNALWPKTAIATAAVMNLLGGQDAIKKCRKPEIVADAAYEVMTADSRMTTGQFFVDEEVLKAAGIQDFEQYSVGSDQGELLPDFFLD